MADQFHVVLEDLLGASAAFRRGADEYGHALPAGLNYLKVDSGFPGLDNSVNAMGDLINAFRSRIIEALAETADKLIIAHDRYQEVENNSVRHLYDQMLELDAISQR